MKRNLFLILLLCITAVCSAFALSACNESDGKDSGGNSVKTAYEIATSLGYDGSLEEFIAQISGKDGVDGKDGIDGTNGSDGLSAYEIWLGNGNTGSEQDFLNWLKGSDGLSVSSATVDGDGDLIITFTNGSKVNCGKVKEEPAEQLQYMAIKQYGEIAAYRVMGAGSVSDTDIIIPNVYKNKPVVEIAPNAFNGSVLTSVTLPDSLISIGDNAFNGCSYLQTVNIPNKVTSIGDDAFKDCSSLDKVFITDISAWCKMRFGNNFSNPINYAGKLYLNDNLVTDLVIPSSVTSIENYAFYGCSTLVSVDVPNSVASIGDSAFSFCESLSSFKFANSITVIGERAFAICPLLLDITLPANLKSIGGRAFHGSPISSIIIPRSVTDIGADVFEFCANLTIRCEAEEKPEGWHGLWNSYNCPVIWGYKQIG